MVEIKIQKTDDGAVIDIFVEGKWFKEVVTGEPLELYRLLEVCGHALKQENIKF